MTRNIKEKTCTACSSSYKTTGSRSLYCEPCGKENAKRQVREGVRRYKLKNGLVKNPGVGKGGAPLLGVANPNYKTGISYFLQNKKRIKEERRYCENPECNKDLIDAKRWDWTVHHIDHDETNNVDSNFQLLCRTCRRIERDCYSALHDAV